MPGVRSLIALVVGCSIFSDYWEYSRAYHNNPQTWAEMMRGSPALPWESRTIVPKLGTMLQQHAHIGLRHGFTAIDLISATVTAYLLYSLFEASGTFQRAGVAVRWAGSATFVFLLQFHFLWMTWYQRTETMAGTVLLAASLWALCGHGLRKAVIPNALRATAILVLAAAEAFVRADLALALHFGVLVVCAGRGVRFALPKIWQVLTSGASILVVVALQYWLLHVDARAGYGHSATAEFKRNLTNYMDWLPFVIFIFPSAWLIRRFAGQQARAEGPWLGLLVGATVYLLVWFAVGRIGEVELFLPYAVALIPLLCMAVMQLLAYDSARET